MTSWVESLPFNIPLDLEELRSNPIEPKRPLDEERGDSVVAEMNDDEKIAFSLWQRCSEEAQRANLDAEFAREEAVEKEALVRHSRMSRVAKVFEAIFWLAVWGHIGDEYESVAITKGFKIITNEHTHSLSDILSSLTREHT